MSAAQKVPKKLKSEFIFTVCQVGAEKALKDEILKNHPSFRFAFSRPGFVTFKNTDGPLAADFVLNSIFARTYGLSLGLVQKKDEGDFELFLLEKIKEAILKLGSHLPLRLHLWERDFYFPGEEPVGFVAGSLIAPVEKKIRELSSFEADPIPKVGDTVLQVVALDTGVWAIGAFVHPVAGHSPFPGGNPGILLPHDAPSRAYLKIEEALLWSKAPVREGDLAVEIGSAPGGASLALLNRGIRVIGIDPADMDPKVLKHKNFKFFKRPVNRVDREELPDSVQWLLLDMNVNPGQSLFAVDRLVTRLSECLLGVFLTIKLNEWRLAKEIPYMISHVQAMGLKNVKAVQLFHNRQEILIYGLTRRGMVR